jgi:hypothetical protein
MTPGTFMKKWRLPLTPGVIGSALASKVAPPPVIEYW